MKPYRLITAVLLFLAIAFGLIWVVAKYMATPAPSGEAYQLVLNWPRLPNGIEIGQVSGVGVDSDGDVFIFHRAEKVWEGEELAQE